MSNSFYGGREGRSFVVVKNFNSIQEMAEAFSQGPAYTEVNFDEYVLINTINKNDPSNGKIFRRGYDFDSDRTYKGIPIGGGVYVGTIVGPAGKAPLLSFKKYDEISKELKIAIIDIENLKTISEMLNYLKNNFPQGKIKVDKDGAISNNGPFVANFVNMISTFDKDGELETLNHYFYYDQLEDRGWYPIDTLPIMGQDQYTPNEMLPGAYYDQSGNIQFNDNIQWGFYSVRNENNEDATAYIGFNFIYPVFEFTSKSIDALETASIKRVDDEEHPFYSKWELAVPKGIKGDAIRNIRVVAENSISNLEDLNSIDSNGVPTFISHPTGENPSGEILVCDYVYYGNNSNGEVHTIYLGDYNVLKEISLNGDGVLNALYTHDGEKKLGTLNWITSVEFIKESGQFNVEFNNSNVESIKAQLKYITSTEEIEKDNSKYVKFNYCNGDSDEFQFGSYNTTPSVIMSELEAGPDQNHKLLNELPNNGIWFVSESVEV